MKRDGFSSRLGLILAALGMAIGTGNLWRFPRIAAKFDGAAFLIPWAIFLFTWSIPILMAEFTLGKTTRRGPIGAFSKLLGRQTAWMGAFMAFTTLMIATYYSVVTGWTLKYLWLSIGDGLNLHAATTPEGIKTAHDGALAHFNGFTDPKDATGHDLFPWQPIAYHLAAVGLGILVVWRGIRSGVELACKIMIPLLFLVLIGGAAWAITQIEGAQRGIAYLTEPKWEHLKTSDIWIQALTQSAWSTGAGWGLILAYGSYARRDEDAVVTNTVAAVGNNCASLLGALFIFPATFALLGMAGMSDPDISAALKDSGPANTGLAFQYVPFIFKSLPAEAGTWCTRLFFGGLFVAALSSLIALYEMGTRVFMDTGMSRGRAVLIVGVLCAGIGIPSAMDMDFFTTMDWVWSIGLIVGGLMVIWAVNLYGVDRYRRELINDTGASIKLRWGWNWIFAILLPVQAFVLLGWWLWEAANNEGYYGKGNDPWDPFVLGHYGVGAPVYWCGTVLVLCMLLSPWLGKWSLRGGDDGGDRPVAPTEMMPAPGREETP